MENKLHLLKEFQNALLDYHVSDNGKLILADTKLALLAGPSLSGRNTIMRELIKSGQYHYIVSDTTRKPRINDGVPEKNGVEYWFRSEKEVLADLKKGKFLEAAIIHGQHVSGISMREIEKARGKKQIAMTDIEIVGVQNIVDAKPDATVFFVIPPSFKEWQRRIGARGEMNQEEVKRRLQSAIKEFESALKEKYYTFIVNDKIDKAVENIHLKAALGHTDLIQQRRGKQITELLYLETQKFLKQQF